MSDNVWDMPLHMWKGFAWIVTGVMTTWYQPQAIRMSPPAPRWLRCLADLSHPRHFSWSVLLVSLFVLYVCLLCLGLFGLSWISIGESFCLFVCLFKYLFMLLFSPSCVRLEFLFVCYYRPWAVSWFAILPPRLVPPRRSDTAESGSERVWFAAAFRMVPLGAVLHSGHWGAYLPRYSFMTGTGSTGLGRGTVLAPPWKKKSYPLRRILIGNVVLIVHVLRLIL